MTIKLRLQVIKNGEVVKESELEVPNEKERIGFSAKIIREAWRLIKSIEE